MDNPILKGMALAFFASAYADQADDAGTPLAGEIMDQLPQEIDPAAWHAARTLYADMARANGLPVRAIFAHLCEECDGEGDRPHTEEIFGHYAAMQAMGHGVGLDDAFGNQARDLVTVPYCEFGAHSLERDYFMDDKQDEGYSMENIKQLAARLRREAMSVVVPRDLDGDTIAAMLDAGLIRVCNDDETRNDLRHEVTDYGLDIVYGRIHADDEPDGAQ